MENAKEKTIALMVMVVLFFGMIVAVFVIIYTGKKNEPTSAPAQSFDIDARDLARNRNLSKKEAEDRAEPVQSKTSSASVASPNNSTESSNAVDRSTLPNSTQVISNPPGSSLLRAEKVDCGQAIVTLYNSSERKDDVNYFITATLLTKINNDSLIAECLDEEGGYHIRSGKKCTIKLKRDIKKGDTIAVYQGENINSPAVVLPLICN